MVDSLDIAALMEQFRIEFLDGGRDRLAILHGILDSLAEGRAGPAEHAEFRRQIHTLKGQAGSFGFPSISHIAHKLEDFLESADGLNSRDLPELMRFVGAIEGVVESGIELSPARIEALLRSLPAFRTAETAQAATSLGVMVVMPRGTWREVASHELAVRGARLQFAENGLTALSLALTVPPDLIVTTMELGDMSGLELAHVFAAIARLARTRFVILTSRDFTNREAADRDGEFGGTLPGTVRVIHKSGDFADNLGRVLKQWRNLS